jgi:hypothetical protein
VTAFLALLGLSGLAWTVVYVDGIRVGLRDKTYAVPLFALGLNLAWEALYAGISLTSGGDFQGVIDVCWTLLDCGILYTYLRYGRRYWPPTVARWVFGAWSILALLVSVVVQLLFLAEFGSRLGSAYSAFLQNLIMSILFISMYVARRGAKGQSVLIGVAKLIGTAAPTIAFGLLAHNRFLLGVGALCAVFDLIYVVLLLYVPDPWGPRGEARHRGGTTGALLPSGEVA